MAKVTIFGSIVRYAQKPNVTPFPRNIDVAFWPDTPEELKSGKRKDGFPGPPLSAEVLHGQVRDLVRSWALRSNVPFRPIRAVASEYLPTPLGCQQWPSESLMGSLVSRKIVYTLPAFIRCAEVNSGNAYRELLERGRQVSGSGAAVNGLMLFLGRRAEWPFGSIGDGEDADALIKSLYYPSYEWFQSTELRELGVMLRKLWWVAYTHGPRDASRRLQNLLTDAALEVGYTKAQLVLPQTRLVFLREELEWFLAHPDEQAAFAKHRIALKKLFLALDA